MKNRWTIVFIGLAVILNATTILQSGEEDAQTLIRRARTVVSSPDRGSEAITRSLAEVLGAALQILPQTDYADDFRARVETARKLFADGVLFSDKGRQYIGLAYKMVSGGKTWQVPEELRTAGGERRGIEKAVEICVKLLDSALAELEAGRNERAVRDLIDFVILVITPIEA